MSRAGTHRPVERDGVRNDDNRLASSSAAKQIPCGRPARALLLVHGGLSSYTILGMCWQVVSFWGATIQTAIEEPVICSPLKCYTLSFPTSGDVVIPSPRRLLDRNAPLSCFVMMGSVGHQSSPGLGWLSRFLASRMPPRFYLSLPRPSQLFRLPSRVFTFAHQRNSYKQPAPTVSLSPSRYYLPRYLPTNLPFPNFVHPASGS